MKRDHHQFQGPKARLSNHGTAIAGSSSSSLPATSTSTICGKDKMMMVKEEEDGGNMDELLAVLGYKVRSSEMAEVALKLEQLETMMGNVQEDNLSQLASDTVHYNPSELYSWLDNMLTELNPPAVASDPIDSSFLNGGAGDSSTITSIGGFAGASDYDLKVIPGNAIYQRSNQFAIDSSSSSSNQNNKRLKSCPSPDSMVTSTSNAAQIGGVIGTTVTTTTTTEAAVAAAVESTRSVILVDSQENGVRLVHALMACAEAIQKNNLTLAEALVKQIGFLAVSQAGAMRKVATYFAEALARRIYRLSPPQNQIDHSLSDTLQMHFYETCPYLKFAHFTANQAILEAFEGKKRVHVIDFSMNQGLQWPSLMQALACRPEGAPIFRLTGIGPPAPDNSDQLHEVGCKLTQLAEAIHIEFEYRGFVANSLADLDASILQNLADYNMLEETKRVAESARRKRMNICKYPFKLPLPYHLKKLHDEAGNRKTNLLFHSTGTMKRENNRTWFDERSRCIWWTIEWRFHSTDVVISDHEISEDTNLCSVIENHLKPSPWIHKLKPFCDVDLDSLKLL